MTRADAGQEAYALCRKYHVPGDSQLEGAIADLSLRVRRDALEEAEAAANKLRKTWEKSRKRGMKHHSGPSYAAAVAGESACEDVIAAIRALAEEDGK